MSPTKIGRDIYKTLERHCAINRVTVDRILDLRVGNGVVDRIEVRVDGVCKNCLRLETSV